MVTPKLAYYSDFLDQTLFPTFSNLYMWLHGSVGFSTTTIALPPNCT